MLTSKLAQSYLLLQGYGKILSWLLLSQGRSRLFSGEFEFKLLDKVENCEEDTGGGGEDDCSHGGDGDDDGGNENKDDASGEDDDGDDIDDGCRE